MEEKMAMLEGKPALAHLRNAYERIVAFNRERGDKFRITHQGETGWVAEMTIGKIIICVSYQVTTKAEPTDPYGYGDSDEVANREYWHNQQHNRGSRFVTYSPHRLVVTALSDSAEATFYDALPNRPPRNDMDFAALIVEQIQQIEYSSSWGDREQQEADAEDEINKKWQRANN
jgi:hypothetical protein